MSPSRAPLQARARHAQRRARREGSPSRNRVRRGLRRLAKTCARALSEPDARCTMRMPSARKDADGIRVGRKASRIVRDGMRQWGKPCRIVRDGNRRWGKPRRIVSDGIRVWREAPRIVWDGIRQWGKPCGIERDATERKRPHRSGASCLECSSLGNRRVHSAAATNAGAKRASPLG